MRNPCTLVRIYTILTTRDSVLKLYRINNIVLYCEEYKMFELITNCTVGVLDILIFSLLFLRLTKKNFILKEKLFLWVYGLS